jgi:hypothetical protein
VPTLEHDDVLEDIKLLASLQRSLVACFLKAHASAEDWKFLCDIPSRGNISCDGQFWFFVKHGVGIEFTSVSGQVVDAHRYFRSQPSAIDAHRLGSFIRSSQSNLGSIEELEDVCEIKLRDLAAQGRLIQVEPGLYVVPAA